MLELLLAEANCCYGHVTQGDDQFARRAFVRAAFAYIEGVTYALKQIALLACEGTFSPGELALLKEESYEVDQAGNLKVRSAKLSTLPNIRLAFAAFARSQATHSSLPVHDHRWDSLRKALVVRHRIMHPKSVATLMVSKSEVQSVYLAGEWFTGCVKGAFAAACSEDAPAVQVELNGELKD